jgi:hypothetical protein
VRQLRGIARIRGVSIMAELDEFSRLAHRCPLIDYSGALLQEHCMPDWTFHIRT